MKWSILYRGPLSGCNYSCDYCPFAKKKDSRAVLEADTQQLMRFVDWVETRTNESIGILFTPWGEALIRKHYQKAIIRLSRMQNVHKVSIQTNLSSSLDWLAECDKSKVALWTTFHPTQTTMDAFLEKCQQLDKLHLLYSVGVVGFKDALHDIEIMRQKLNPKIYLWINALKKQADYYTAAEVNQMKINDPYIEFNLINHSSKGHACRAGNTTFSVNGAGNITRCHFIKTVIGNIYDADFEKNLFPRACTNETCGCHIGYVHLERLKMETIFGERLLERIAERF